MFDDTFKSVILLKSDYFEDKKHLKQLNDSGIYLIYEFRNFSVFRLMSKLRSFSPSGPSAALTGSAYVLSHSHIHLSHTLTVHSDNRAATVTLVSHQTSRLQQLDHLTQSVHAHNNLLHYHWLQ